MDLAYRPRHKPCLTNLILTKWKPNVSTKGIPQYNSHIYLYVAHNIHQHHKSHPPSFTSLILKLYTDYNFFLNNPVTILYHLHYSTTTNTLIHSKYSILKRPYTSHIHPHPHPRLKFPLPSQTQSSSTKSMASAYRPRHIYYSIYHTINNMKPNSVTNYIPPTQKTPHFFIYRVQLLIHAIPNLFTTTNFLLVIYIKINMHKPKTLYFKGYYFINKLALLQCGDIELNPGPMPNILSTHPHIHKNRANMYFIPNTIKLHPEYQHIAHTFAPLLKPTHLLHSQETIIYPHLHQLIQTHRQVPPSHMLYALIITIHPLIDTCNNILASPQTYHFNIVWTNMLLSNLATLTNPPKDIY